MEKNGLTQPVLNAQWEVYTREAQGYHKIFQAFGLVRKLEHGTIKWYYPSSLDNLAFDSTALRIALTKPLDSIRLYLSTATLIVVPANLIDHWITQIQKHVNPGHLRAYVWADNRKPSAHNLAWDYDVVLTTFNKLSAEWGPRKWSVLMQVHWLRIMLDEGHTLGSSLSLTNKLQMAVSLTAASRWILTGTPTPNTPNSQVAHLQPMLKFLHDEACGQNQESWEAGILRPFEAQMEEGRCEDWCRLPVITPCRHMLCLDCVALDSERCTLPGCGYPYEMQSPETIARPENPNPKWPDDWDPDWQSTSSSKVAYLVERLKVLQETNRKIGESVDGIDKTMELLYSSKANCSFLVHRKAWSTQKSESCKVLPEKVIVFSQFLEHIHVVEQQLTVAGIIFAKMYSPMHSSNKMDRHLILTCTMNLLYVISMEEQVISRAHRMGATRPINVETLAMYGTIEEQMLKFLQDVNAGRETFKQEGDKDEYEGTRTRRTLHNFAETAMKEASDGNNNDGESFGRLTVAAMIEKASDGDVPGGRNFRCVH
ncbi:CW-type Zinc Finger [Musa troglodytarum]|uniref:CW-type Zinc Finger n=1 Tax=Musa troglodytarum TaxID=320322 RepID=A0A9E7EN43_9LILI|nr:CW-type Zinc Finger [Musa troglodytarum]